jgi:formylglycine-generating enzyme required for sulfatase activity
MRWSAFLLLGSLVGCAVVGAEEPEEPGEGGETALGCAAAECTSGLGPNAARGEEAAPTSSDGQRNGDESDVDCGGASTGAPRCAAGSACAAATDCESAVCTGGKCQVPSGTDGVKNGDESDIDCGGATTGAPRCDAGKSCAAHGDCASDGCGYDQKCALAPSCAGHFGGDTCGEGEVGEPGAKHESCCTAAPVPGMTTKLDKYVVTAGRFRQFVERTNGNIRGFAQSLGAKHPDWKPEWTAELPASLAETNYLLGPTGNGTSRRGCDLGASRARTYWMSDAENKALGETGTHPFSKDVLDQKALNCVDWYMVQAFCVWDGGRIATSAEIKAAWEGGEGRAYPWGNTFDNARLNWKYSYSFPYVYDQGNFVFVGAPGRRPSGNAKNGHADLAGLGMEWLNDISPTNPAQARFSGAGSWEGHTVMQSSGTNGYTPMNRAYWAIVGRCAR